MKYLLLLPLAPSSPVFSFSLLSSFSSFPSSVFSTCLLSFSFSKSCYCSLLFCMLTLTLCLLVPCCRAGERRMKRNMWGLSLCLSKKTKTSKDQSLGGGEGKAQIFMRTKPEGDRELWECQCEWHRSLHRSLLLPYCTLHGTYHFLLIYKTDAKLHSEGHFIRDTLLVADRASVELP